ncbi:MAG: FAD-binding oxidoreductase [Pseudohongiellaceae bacterium]
MPDPKFSKPWHGVPREEIHWNPSIIEDACIGCGTCVTGCSRMVYRFDFVHKKPVVVDPLNCMVGCTTCANTCPAHAITFPAIESVLALEGLPRVRHAVEDDLLARREILAAQLSIPHPDRIISLQVQACNKLSDDVLQLVLIPETAGECFCEFVPGQYIELWQPAANQLSRAYSIVNTPEGDGRIELHIRRVEGGRFSQWAFDTMKPGDRLSARGPLGTFTMRSDPSAPLLFVAGGTGYAPVHALLLQQLKFQAGRDMTLVWGMHDADQFYAVDELLALLERAGGLRIILACEQGDLALAAEDRISMQHGTVVDVLQRDESLLPGRDVYGAGPPMMLRGLARFLSARGIDPQHVHMDSFGV